VTALWVTSAVAVSLVTDACRPPASSCQANSDCQSNEVCFAGGCRRACNSNAECASDESCYNGVCQPGSQHADAAVSDGPWPDVRIPDQSNADRSAGDRRHADLPQLARAADAAGSDRSARDLALASEAAADTVAPFDAAADTAAPVDAAAHPDATAGGDGGQCLAPNVQCSGGYCRTRDQCCVNSDCGSGEWICSTTSYTCVCGGGTGAVCSGMCCGRGDFYCNFDVCSCDGIVCASPSASCWVDGDCCTADDCGGQRCIGHQCTY